MSETEVRLLTEDDFDAFVVIVANAYPSAQDSPTERQRMRGRWITQSADPKIHLYGAFRENTLLGGMLLYDFTMTFGSSGIPHTDDNSDRALHNAMQVPVGGVGTVAVDLIHKKEHVARDLMTFFLGHYRDQGTPLVLLYPFRPDFYKQMGFGYGTKMNEYRVRPAALPNGQSKAHLAALAREDSDLLLEYYNRYQQETHGMLGRSIFEVARKFANPQSHLIGYLQDGQLHGYLQYRFKSASEQNFLVNDLEVVECLYDTPEVLAEFLTFLRTQADQIRSVIFWTQDEDFHYLLQDPRNGSEYLMPHVYHASNVQGIGLMYRVLDTDTIFRCLSSGGYRFDNLLSCCLHVKVTDTFLPENDGVVVIQFENGLIQSVERKAAPEPAGCGVNKEVAIELDVADFSSLLLGVIGFKTLYAYGLAQLSDPAELDRVHRLFRTEVKPRCVTAF